MRKIYSFAADAAEYFFYRVKYWLQDRRDEKALARQEEERKLLREEEDEWEASMERIKRWSDK